MAVSSGHGTGMRRSYIAPPPASNHNSATAILEVLRFSPSTRDAVDMPGIYAIVIANGDFWAHHISGIGSTPEASPRGETNAMSGRY